MTDQLLLQQTASATDHGAPRDNTDWTLLRTQAHVMPDGSLVSLNVIKQTGFQPFYHLGLELGTYPYTAYQHYMSTFAPDGALEESALVASQHSFAYTRVGVGFNVARNHGVYVEINVTYDLERTNVSYGVEVLADGTLGTFIQKPSNERLNLNTTPHSVESLHDTPSSDPDFGEFQQLTFPDGRRLITFVRQSDEGQTLFVQFFSADGSVDGMPVAVVERGLIHDYSITANRAGYAWIQYDSTLTDDDTEGLTRGFAAFDIIAPRQLTSARDWAYLASTGAIDGRGGNDTISGSDGDDRILGGSGNDLLGGGPGDDLMRGGAGDDTLYGGAGDADTAFFRGRWQDYDIEATEVGYIVTGTGDSATDGRDILVAIERLVFSDLSTEPDRFLAAAEFQAGATAANDWFYGTDVDDTLSGLDGDDTLNGKEGDDRIDGGAGNDSLSGDGGADTLIGADGDDSIIGGQGANDLIDYVYGGAGDDTIYGGRGADVLRGDSGDDFLFGGLGGDRLIGGSGDDVISGGNSSDYLFGGAGNDILRGGHGHDRLHGGDGADSFLHTGIRAGGTDWIQDFSVVEGDQLVSENSGYLEGFFRVVFTDIPGAGDAGVAEAEIFYLMDRDFTIWTLVDGAALDTISIRIGGDTFDILG